MKYNTYFIKKKPSNNLGKKYYKLKFNKPIYYINSR